MKNIILILIIITYCNKTSANNDSLKKHKLFIHTIPSNILMGDASLGIEHLYKKRFSNEFLCYINSFDSPLHSYYRGYRLNYQLKYNFINRSYFRMSVNLSTSYRYSHFENKEDYWYENSPDISTKLSPTYIMDRESRTFGIGGGFGLNFKLTKHFYIGHDVLLELSNKKKLYAVKQRVDADGSYHQFTEPYYYDSNGYSNFIFYHIILNFKVSYLL